MRTTLALVLSFAALVAFAGCSEDDTTDTPGAADAAVDAVASSDSASAGDASAASDVVAEDASTDASADAPATEETDASDAQPNVDSAFPTFTLTLENYDSWCSVSVNSGFASTTGRQVLTFPVGTVVDLAGAPANGTFIWGYWVGTAGDTLAAHDQNTSTTVTMDQDRLVQACCPFASAPGNPCPPPTP
jgi:hypothetical protein